MDPVYIPLLSALAGAFIGSLSSIITLVVQGRAESRRNRYRLATELALQEYKFRWGIIEKAGGVLPPFSSFLHHHLELTKSQGVLLS
jgi:hypothetical protein